MKFSWSGAFAFGAACLVHAQGVSAQSKVEAQVEAELRRKDRVRVVVVTRPDPDQAGGGAALSSPAAYLSGRLGSAASNVKAIGSFSAISAEVSRDALERLREDPNVALVTRDVPARPSLSESVALIGATKLHTRGFRGTDYNVAVLDTGVDTSHAGLANAVVAEACFSTQTSLEYKVASLCPGGFDMSTMPGAAAQCPVDLKGCEHGSHVAGIVAGRDMSFEGRSFGGVAPAAGVVAVQVFTLFDDEGECGAARRCVLSFTSDQLRALDWVYKKRDELKIAAVNMSLGSGYFDRACDATSALTQLIERLRAKSIATVVAAGNDAYYDGVSEPACVSSAVTVAASRKDGALDVAYSNISTLVDFAAPGTAIVSTVPGGGYKALEGTSMAAPHVAAAFALMRQQYPSASVLEIQRMLVKDAPTVVDPRNGTTLVALELEHAMSQAPTSASGTVVVAPSASATAGASSGAPGTSAPAASPAPSPQPEVALKPSIASSSFIIQSKEGSRPGLQAEIQSSLDTGCTGFTCNLKQISPDAWRLEMAPRSGAGGSGAATPSKAEVESILRDKREIRVFDNRLSRPKGVF